MQELKTIFLVVKLKDFGSFILENKMKKILILRFKRGVDKKETERMMKNVSENLSKLNIAHIVMTDDIQYEVITVSDQGTSRDE